MCFVQKKKEVLRKKETIKFFCNNKSFVLSALRTPGIKSISSDFKIVIIKYFFCSKN